MQNFPISTGGGSLEAARGTKHVALDGVELTGEQDIFGVVLRLGRRSQRRGSWYCLVRRVSRRDLERFELGGFLVGGRRFFVGRVELGGFLVGGLFVGGLVLGWILLGSSWACSELGRFLLGASSRLGARSSPGSETAP